MRKNGRNNRNIFIKCDAGGRARKAFDEAAEECDDGLWRSQKTWMLLKGRGSLINHISFLLIEHNLWWCVKWIHIRDSRIAWHFRDTTPGCDANEGIRCVRISDSKPERLESRHFQNSLEKKQKSQSQLLIIIHKPNEECRQTTYLSIWCIAMCWEYTAHNNARSAFKE